MALIQRCVGRTLVTSVSKPALTIISFVLAVEKRERGYHAPYLFRSYPFIETEFTDFNRNPQERTDLFDLVDVCRATSAAPQYFGSLRIQERKFQDGSRWAFNPSLEAYREISSMHYAKDNPNPICYMLSVGCGESKNTRYNKSLLSRNSLVLRTIREDEQGEHMMREMNQNSEFGYCRLSGSNLISEIEESNWTSAPAGVKIFDEIRRATETYCKKNRKEMQEAASQLVKIRQLRAATSQWEEFAFGYKYVCIICKRDETAPKIVRFDHRADFVDHLRRRHDKPPETEEFLPELQKIISESRTTDTLL